MTPRSSADVAAELVQRKARQAELTDRRALTSADLQAKRTARARTLAEGSKKGPTAAEIATLQEEYDSIGAALTLLAEDVEVLEKEAREAQLVEAKVAQAAAIADATHAIAALDAVLRRAVAEMIVAASDAFNVAMKAARAADNDLDRLRRKASAGPLAVLPGVSERVLNRRTRLLALVADIRTYCDSHPERIS